MQATTIHESNVHSRTTTRPRAVDFANPSVLLVEDDIDCARGTAIWLEHLGYPVSMARDGVQAIEMIEQEDPGAVLLDLGLPGMHGLKVLHEMRMRGLDQPVIVLTATSDQASLDQAYGMGATYVLRKPANRAQLRELLGELTPDPFGGLLNLDDEANDSSGPENADDWASR